MNNESKIPKSERSIFQDAIELTERDQRQAFVAKACGADSELRLAVEQLLASHESTGNLLDEPRAEMVLSRSLFDELANQPASNVYLDLVGTWIGRYKLMELIGEGGFGLVYVAEQHQPVRRQVALKIIKPGMNSKDVIARFEAERQALAMMDHPHIAKVLDAGISEDQRLYFVMELVRGIPITEFCDQQRLTLPQRVELFCDVCAAIQHAHQKGVIHRDIKPSNVMVTLHDVKHVVKVIDFGVAKAIGQRLTDKTIYTRFLSIIGTPAYMSPEQAEMSGLDIDTRSDIYSLGVLLYELLTGTTPFERARLDSAGYDEMRRIILEEDPVKPSNRITTLGERQSTISNSRCTEPRRLAIMISGDLDWIVLKALEKDRNRRYESASALADDLKRFLHQEPVAARAPTLSYRFQKYCRRNRIALATFSAIAAALVIGTGASLWQAYNAITERNQKQNALQDALLAKNDALTARREVEEFSERLKTANLLNTSGQAYADARQWSAAYQDFSRAIEIQPKYFLVWVQRAQLLARLNCWEESAADYEAAASLGAPVDEPSWWGAPQLFWYTNRHAEYQSVVNRMWEPSATVDSTSWNAIRNRLIHLPPGDQAEQVAELAEAKLSADRSNENRRPPLARAPFAFESSRRPQPGADSPDGNPPRGMRPPPRNGRLPFSERDRDGRRSREWVPRGAKNYITGWAALRAGRTERAVELLKRTPDVDRNWPGQSLIHFPLAMAYQEMGEFENARASFDEGKRVLDTWLDTIVEQPEGRLPIPWFDFVEAEILFREASVLIDGELPPPDPRLQERREKNLSLLGTPIK